MTYFPIQSQVRRSPYELYESRPISEHLQMLASCSYKGVNPGLFCQYCKDNISTYSTSVLQSIMIQLLPVLICRKPDCCFKRSGLLQKRLKATFADDVAYSMHVISQKR